MKVVLLFLLALALTPWSSYGAEEPAYQLQTPGKLIQLDSLDNSQSKFPLTPFTGWGGVSFPGSEQRDDKDNTILEGAFEQGVDLYTYQKIRLTAFGNLNYVKDSQQFDYNNKVKLGLGVKLRYFPLDNVSLDVGIKYELDRRFESSQNFKGWMGFVNWYAGWSLDSLLGADKRSNTKFQLTFPGYTWGGVRYPGSQTKEEAEILVLEGSVEQGVDWYKFHRSTLNSFVVFDYVLDTEGFEWNNNITYGIGSKIKVPIKKITMHVGLQFNQNKRLHSGRTADKVIFFVRWLF